MPLVQGEGGSLEGNYHLSFCFLPVSTPLPPVSMVSPLKPEVFAAKLSQHPDQHLVAFVLDGLRNGFRLGFQHSKKLKSAKSNKASANQHSEVIDRYLANEVSLGRVAGLFPLHLSLICTLVALELSPKRVNQASGGS